MYICGFNFVTTGWHSQYKINTYFLRPFLNFKASSYTRVSEIHSVNSDGTDHILLNVHTAGWIKLKAEVNIIMQQTHCLMNSHYTSTAVED